MATLKTIHDLQEDVNTLGDELVEAEATAIKLAKKIEKKKELISSMILENALNFLNNPAMRDIALRTNLTGVVWLVIPTNSKQVIIKSRPFDSYISTIALRTSGENVVVDTDYRLPLDKLNEIEDIYLDTSALDLAQGTALMRSAIALHKQLYISYWDAEAPSIEKAYEIKDVL